MCGIAGYLAIAPGTAEESVVRAMSLRLHSRGPDDHGAWVDPAKRIALGHRRLSIVDLTFAGHQPMASAGGRYVIAYNGEIYNHVEIRAELELAGAAPAWRGHSDTETLLAAFEQWGVEATLCRAVGMFALAAWDQQEGTLRLARDRFGEKPLYYGWSGNGTAADFVFASELKALRAHPRFANAVSRESLAQYMRFMCVPAPRSIYEGIFKLEPGCILTLEGIGPPRAPAEPLCAPSSHGGLRVDRWWSLSDIAVAGLANPITDPQEALDRLESTLSEAVRGQLLGDVSLGAFLSGGVDSSLVVALMQKHSAQPVRTFTVGFAEAGFDESLYARAVARHLGTSHSEQIVTSNDALAVVPLLPEIYDEPFADSSQIATHLVCRSARQHVTVALSGDAGDELFGGYNRYVWSPRLWKKLAWLPFPARRLAGGMIASVPERHWDALARPVNSAFRGSSGVAQAGHKAHKLAARLRTVRDQDGLNRSLISEWQDPAELVRGANGRLVEPPTSLECNAGAAAIDDVQLRMMYEDSIFYLPNDILCKVDRAAMAVSLETRVPFLDHRVAEIAWRLPLHMKIRGGEGKWALRQLLNRYVPKALIDRPKAGFAIPLHDWLRGALRPWAEALLDESRLLREGYLNPGPVRQRWCEHLEGRRNHTASLWAVLMFQAWLEAQEVATPC